MMRQPRMASRSSSNAPLTRGQLTALVVLFIITAFALLMLDRRSLLNPLKGAAERPIMALSERFTALGDGLRHFSERFGNVADLRAENERLQAENDRLRAADARVKELERENTQLTAQANFAKLFPDLQSVPARVIGRDPTSSEKVLIIDRGSDDGLVVGMPVVSPDFFVGQIVEVYPQRSKVRLIIDQDMHVGVLLQDERGAGVMDGRWQSGGRLTVRFIDRDVPVKLGSSIITSNLTNHVPKGLVVGFVTKITKDEQTDTLQLEVVPYVNFDGLESVSVILTGER
jgi:rod shape-determining protein MreC